MKKIYEKPIIHATVINVEEITSKTLLSSAYTIHTEELTTKSWTTINY
ncbi:MAG: hypothetical protein LIO44_05050 [Eubacterium sp.]|nr:hypothetical protein [Eubacterium sp.]